MVLLSKNVRNWGISLRRVAIVMGSDSDLSVMRTAADTLKSLGVPFSVRVISAHRTPDAARDFARAARDEGYGAIIAAAGKAAHLAGAIAANTTLPVIGVPIKSSTLNGLEALLSTVEMPPGMPVATVAIDGAKNAALLACEMLAIEDAALAEKLSENRADMARAIAAKDEEIRLQFE